MQLSDTRHGHQLLRNLIEGWHDYQYCQHRLQQLNRPWLARTPLRWKHSHTRGWRLSGSVLPPTATNTDR